MAKRSQRRNAKPAGRFRIIGGNWRGRRLEFPPLPGLRPTPDRVRETLFNWLQPLIEGAVCLDLFAGSGALGLEALSRGAGRVVFVDRDQAVLDRIRDHLATLDCSRARLVAAEAQRYLASCGERFDVVFLDPPFDARPWDAVLGSLAGGSLLEQGGRIYMENLAADGAPPMPAGLRLTRVRRAGRVGYYLAERSEDETR